MIHSLNKGKIHTGVHKILGGITINRVLMMGKVGTSHALAKKGTRVVVLRAQALRCLLLKNFSDETKLSFQCPDPHVRCLVCKATWFFNVRYFHTYKGRLLQVCLCHNVVIKPKEIK